VEDRDFSAGLEPSCLLRVIARCYERMGRRTSPDIGRFPSANDAPRSPSMRARVSWLRPLFWRPRTEGWDGSVQKGRLLRQAGRGTPAKPESLNQLGTDRLC
jgi:hypothetical protein